MWFQHTAARRRLDHIFRAHCLDIEVSTLSRPKAAGWETVKAALISGWFQHSAARRRLDHRHCNIKLFRRFQHSAARRRLEDGLFAYSGVPLFQHSAARRRLDELLEVIVSLTNVSTLSRPKAAGGVPTMVWSVMACFNTQPPEGGWDWGKFVALLGGVSTLSRPKAAGSTRNSKNLGAFVFQHSAARRRLVTYNVII